MQSGGWPCRKGHAVYILIRRELKAQQTKLCTIRWKFPQLSWGICINIGPFTVQYSAWPKRWIQVKCYSHNQALASYHASTAMQMHEEREQLKIDCTCMDISSYKPLNPGQPNLYHLLGSVGGWTMTSGSVHWCSCCHWSSEAIRKHMWSIRALPSTQIHAAMSRNQLHEQTVTCLETIKLCTHACRTSTSYQDTWNYNHCYLSHAMVLTCMILMATNYNSLIM